MRGLGVGGSWLRLKSIGIVESQKTLWSFTMFKNSCFLFLPLLLTAGFIYPMETAHTGNDFISKLYMELVENLNAEELIEQWNMNRAAILTIRVNQPICCLNSDQRHLFETQKQAIYGAYKTVFENFVREWVPCKDNAAFARLLSMLDAPYNKNRITNSSIIQKSQYEAFKLVQIRSKVLAELHILKLFGNHSEIEQQLAQLPWLAHFLNDHPLLNI